MLTLEEQTEMIRIEDVYRIGVIGKPHGVKGEVSFNFDDDVFDRVDTDYLILLIDGILVPFYFDEYRFHGNTVALMKFCDISDTDSARYLTGCEVFFPKSLSDSYNESSDWNCLDEFSLYNGDKLIGTITSIDDSTDNILFEVETTNNHKILIPAAEDLIRVIDNNKKKIIMELPDGLLDV